MTHRIIAAAQGALDDIRADRLARLVKVKPLEWQAHPDGMEWFSVDKGAWGISDYWLSPNPVGSDFRLHVRGHLLGEEFETIAEAKAAAQADYEARILAALDLPDAQKGEA